MAIDPRTLLAHHHPFLCIDTIDEVETGQSARGTKLVAGSVWLAIGYFMGINNARFRGKAVPGEVLSIHVELRQFHRGSCTTHRTALVDGRSVVRADITTIVRPAAAAAPLTVASRDAAAAARRGARLAAARYRAAPSRRILLHALQQWSTFGRRRSFLGTHDGLHPGTPKDRHLCPVAL